MRSIDLVSRRCSFRPDAEIVAAVRDGDHAAFGLLVDRHYSSLLRDLTFRTGDQNLAEDIAQDTFLRAFKQIHQLRRDRPFAPWLFGIARNQLRMMERRQRLKRMMSLEQLIDRRTAAVPALHHSDCTRSCQEALLIQQTLAGLKPPLREALLLHSLDGFKAPAVAEILGISLSAAERRISRGKERFRERYQALSEDNQP